MRESPEGAGNCRPPLPVPRFARLARLDAEGAGGLVAQETAGQANVGTAKDRDPLYVECADGRIAGGGEGEGAAKFVDVVRATLGTRGVNAAALLQYDGGDLPCPRGQGASRHAVRVGRRHAFGHLSQEHVQLCLAVPAQDLPQDEPGQFVRSLRPWRAGGLRGWGFPFRREGGAEVGEHLVVHDVQEIGQLAGLEHREQLLQATVTAAPHYQVNYVRREPRDLLLAGAFYAGDGLLDGLRRRRLVQSEATDQATAFGRGDILNTSTLGAAGGLGQQLFSSGEDADTHRRGEGGQGGGPAARPRPGPPLPGEG